MLRSGVRDLVSATVDGGALQAPLQHVRLAGGVYSGAPRAPVRGREAARPTSPHPLPRVGRRERSPAVPFPYHGYGALALHAGFHLLAFRVSNVL